MLTVRTALESGCLYPSAMTHGADWTRLFQVAQVYISPPAAPWPPRRALQRLAFERGPWGTLSAQEKDNQKQGSSFSDIIA